MAGKDQFKPMVEIAENIIRQNGKQNLKELFKQVSEIKGFANEDAEKAALLYLDMTLSSNFVYCGNDEWDLKENNLELWDKDGSYFMKIDEVDFDDEDDEDIVLEDYYSVTEDDIDLSDADEDDEKDPDAEEEEEIEYLLDDDIPFYSTDDDDVKQPDLDFDDEDYHEIMDDYEDMYED